MSLTKKNTKRSAVKRTAVKTVIVTKSTHTGPSLFPEKVKLANALLAKTKLLP
jgi:hypothetical protein